MLKQIANAIKEKLLTYTNLKQVEIYEGQLDPSKIGEWAIVTPAVFIEYMDGNTEGGLDIFDKVAIRLHVLVTKLLHDPGNMLDTLEWLLDNFHKDALIQQSPVVYNCGRSFVKDFVNEATLAGFTYYTVNLEIVK